jgi:hypothetical protein
VNLANGVARLGIRCGRDRAGVYDNDVGVGGFVRGGAAALAQLALEGGAVSLRGTAAELFDVKGRHLFSECESKNSTQGAPRTQSGAGSGAHS